MKQTSNPNLLNRAKCICGNDLTGRQKKFCSKHCKNQDTNTRHKNYENQQDRGFQRKIDLTNQFGGQCKSCGYKKNYACLSFHHLNPSTKKFGLDLRNCSNRSWEALTEEAAKCELLCLNCHSDLHHPAFRLG